MKKLIQIVTIIISVFINFSIFSIAQCNGDNNFIGSTNDEWIIASNWSETCVPTSPITGNIIISSDCIYPPLLNIIFETGSTLNILSGISLSNHVWTCEEPLIYDGQSYTTAQIGSQCWMSENLNVGIMVNGNIDQVNNSSIEKYCYNNDINNCSSDGALYQWDEMMQYSTNESVKGICPVGWHLPSDDEIKALEMHLGMSQTEADNTSYRGTNEASKLSTNEPLWSDGNLDQNTNFGTSEFAALPVGIRTSSGMFASKSSGIVLWSSSESNTNAWRRDLLYSNSMVYRATINKSLGASVRCLKD